MTSRDTSKPSSDDAQTPSDLGVFSLPISDDETLRDDEELSEDDVPLSYEDYADRYVAFIDILGFKEIVRNSRNQGGANSASSLNSIFNALNLNFKGLIKDYESQSGASSSDLRVNTFSDFVVISCHATEAGLDLLIFVVWCVVRDWLSKGYLSRGGVAKGPVIHVGGDANSPGMVFGPAFIDAYTLEQEVADYPRVVFSKSVRADIKNLRENGQDPIRAIKKLVVRCDDGPMSIDTFGHLRRNGFEFLGNDHKDEAMQFSRTLLQQVDHGADVPRWYRKTAWLVTQFNDAVSGTDYAGRTVRMDER